MMETIDFKKGDGLIPAIVQNDTNSEVLMLGYMNKESMAKTFETGKLCFYSRSKQRLWTKGETSGNYLNYVSHALDCDKDAIIFRVQPVGPTCHTGSKSCFGSNGKKSFVHELESIIADRADGESQSSYTKSLLERGLNKVAQKVGEEATELIIESKDDNKELFIGEAADLLYHFLVLLQAKDVRLNEVENELIRRNEL